MSATFLESARQPGTNPTIVPVSAALDLQSDSRTKGRGLSRNDCRPHQVQSRRDIGSQRPSVNAHPASRQPQHDSIQDLPGTMADLAHAPMRAIGHWLNVSKRGTEPRFPQQSTLYPASLRRLACIAESDDV